MIYKNISLVTFDNSSCELILIDIVSTDSHEYECDDYKRERVTFCVLSEPAELYLQCWFFKKNRTRVEEFI